MPIRIPDDLPGRPTLEEEGVRVMDRSTAIRQDIRPLRIGLLNLMPNRVETEVQFARLLGASPLQIELTLVRLAAHQPTDRSRPHLDAFYRDWDELKDEKFDGFLITGAPLGMVPYEEITYWEELKTLLDWTETHVFAPLFVCWGAMAALHHFHGIAKEKLEEKASGVFPHTNHDITSPWLAGLGQEVPMPVSRWTTIPSASIEASDKLRMLLSSEATGAGLIEEPATRRLYMLNHLEYEAESLKEEYERDLAKGEPAKVPVNYFDGDDSKARPRHRWKPHGHLFYAGWVNEIYQAVPFDWTETT
ncbi:homoserine O-succinyltransferase [Parvularcula sp. ZS-1/3]|uniref:Homoserine O-succinyltransferase n=1 Tax=Parvularcula mediterranea TaxID=2732508 RepID=A0A7Y3RKU6_9PROT|nr:homoserine O-succinyltransferase [Parvularcula mediterranea]NNU15386.1 homoserine O-succinyltransferase [Parvularcula mediterranea]